VSKESAAEYHEYYETREELAVVDGGWDPWVKCAVCEEFLHKDEALKLDGLWFHETCLSDKDRVKAIMQEEMEGLTGPEDEEEVV